MSGKEIVMSVVNGLMAEHVQVDMMHYGYVEDGVCFGCAATNAICEIAGLKFTSENIELERERAEAIGADQYFLYDFELAINYLRKGDIEGYNKIAEEIDIVTLPEVYLPMLNTSDWREKIHHYKAYADAL